MFNYEVLKNGFANEKVARLLGNVSLKKREKNEEK